MRVLYFGTYERDYPRNAHTIRLLRRAGIAVVERHELVWEGRRDAWRAGPRVALRLARAQVRLARRVHGEFDAAVIGYPGHADVISLRRALPDTPLILNPLVSLHDTLVADRSRFRASSVAARVLRGLDRHAFAAADVVVADTKANAELFAALGARRIEVCRVGADERVFHPPWQPADEQRVLFVGKLIPLHGIRTVVAAARAVQSVRFRIVGTGQEQRELDELPTNVEWIRWVEYDLLGNEYRRAWCALGIFGTSAKAARVVPNKAYHALACGTPLVTADTPAARELLRDGDSAVLAPAGDGDALADAIRRIVGDETLRAQLSRGGHAAFRAHASDDVLAERWSDVVRSVAR